MKIKFLIATAAAALSFGVASAQAAPAVIDIIESPSVIAPAKVDSNRVRKEQLRKAQKLLEQYKQATKD